MHDQQFLTDAELALLPDHLEHWKKSHPACGVLALVAEASKAQIPVLQSLCQGQNIPLAGAIFPRLIHGNSLIEQGMWLICFEHAPRFKLISGFSHDTAADTASILASLTPQLAPRRQTLFMLFDAMVPHIGSLLDGLYLELADRVSYIGLNAGSESFQPLPCLFDNRQIVGNGLLWLLLDVPHGAVIAHGYHSQAPLVTASSTEGNAIVSIDWQPAFQVYQLLVKTRYGIELTPENFYQYAAHFPFGILRANEESLVRIPVAVREDGALLCVGEIPSNAVLALLHAPDPGSDETIDQLVSRLPARPGQPLLTFYCAGRRLHLQATGQDELVMLQQRSGATELFGALTLGEIGHDSNWGYPVFHNGAIVCCPWS